MAGAHHLILEHLRPIRRQRYRLDARLTRFGRRFELALG